MKQSKFGKLLNIQTTDKPIDQSSDKPVKGRGGKSSDDRYRLAGAWLPKDLLTDVKVQLLKDGGGEFSLLVEKLLREWLAR